MHDQADTSAAAVPQPGGRIRKVLVLVLVVSTAGILYAQFGDQLSLESFAKNESRLRQFQGDHPVLVYGMAFLLYAAITGLSLPGAAGMTLLFAWFFGLWQAILLVSFASTFGATLAFLLSRYLLRDAVQRKFGDRLRSFNDALASEGAFYLFTLRLLPVVPFFVINLVMGLTPLRTWTFWWVSQLGMLPGTAVYCYAGSSVPDLQTLAEEGAQAVFSPGQLLQITLAFSLLGVFPLVAKKLLQWWGPSIPESIDRAP